MMKNRSLIVEHLSQSRNAYQKYGKIVFPKSPHQTMNLHIDYAHD